MKGSWRHLSYGVAFALALYIGGLLWRPVPISVETAVVKQGAMQVSVEDEGELRAHDRYLVTAPITGRLLRIELHEGDPVRAGEVIAMLTPLPVSSWQNDELQARLAAAIAHRQESQADLARAKLLQEQAERERTRHQQLLTKKLVSQQQMEDAEAAARTAAMVAQASTQRLRAAEAEVAATKASLAAVDATGAVEPLKLYSPVDGYVLDLIEASERVLNSGAPIMLIGDPANLEAQIELLSTEAVRVKPGMPVEIHGWGGDETLAGKVRLIEQSAFTKISTLGVEEQRVRVIVDLDNFPASLGDGFHVEARIIVWQSDDAVYIPVGALFRHQEKWQVFVAKGDMATTRDIEIGQRNRQHVQVLKGVHADEQVIVYPPSDLESGSRIRHYPK